MTYHAAPLSLPDPDASPEFYASIPSKRLVAWVLDTALILAFCVVVLVLTLGIAFFFLPPLYLVVSFVYRTATLARGSATWGMAVMAMEIRRHDGARLDWLTALLHTLGYTVSVAFFLPQVISVLMMLITPRAQGLSDYVLGTAAVNCRA
ncbi:RDD family protein [Roseovarius dicentrarchi]|uniref:RDD family protein n=1 Tax=Roseovarius dicentrarchi TaxID=2250573 RepID=UPI000DEB050B|nr:RDD family protein [Roseovarius dicentrarchi]